MWNFALVSPSCDMPFHFRPMSDKVYLPGHRLYDLGFESPIDARIFLFSIRPDRLRDQFGFLFSEQGGVFPVGTATGHEASH